MRVKFSVLGSGHTSFHSNKLNRDYNRVRLMGFVEDFAGEKIPATADMGFDVPLSDIPKAGDEVVLTISELSTKSSMVEVVFQKIEPFVPVQGSRK